MNNQEMLKQNLVDKRLTLASLLFNASSVMSDQELEDMRESILQMHKTSSQGENLEQVASKTDDLIEHLTTLLDENE